MKWTVYAALKNLLQLPMERGFVTETSCSRLRVVENGEQMYSEPIGVFETRPELSLTQQVRDRKRFLGIFREQITIQR